MPTSWRAFSNARMRRSTDLALAPAFPLGGGSRQCRRHIAGVTRARGACARSSHRIDFGSVLSDDRGVVSYVRARCGCEMHLASGWAAIRKEGRVGLKWPSFSRGQGGFLLREFLLLGHVLHPRRKVVDLARRAPRRRIGRVPRCALRRRVRMQCCGGVSTAVLGNSPEGERRRVGSRRPRPFMSGLGLNSFRW